MYVFMFVYTPIMTTEGKKIKYTNNQLTIWKLRKEYSTDIKYTIFNIL